MSEVGSEKHQKAPQEQRAASQVYLLSPLRTVFSMRLKVMGKSHLALSSAVFAFKRIFQIYLSISFSGLGLGLANL